MTTQRDPLASAASQRQPDLRWLWRGLLLLLLGIVTWLALTPAPPPSADLGWDKLNHAAAFAALGVAALRGFEHRSALVVLALLGYGALIEVMQSFTPTRQAEWSDLLADAGGLGAACLLLATLAWLSKRWRARKAG